MTLLYRIMFLAETVNNIMMPRLTNFTKCINAGVTYNGWTDMFTHSPSFVWDQRQ